MVSYLVFLLCGAGIGLALIVLSIFAAKLPAPGRALVASLGAFIAVASAAIALFSRFFAA